ncbi:MAG: hypothetical protein QW059_06420 [Nitrososphaerota archaeon]
MIRRRHLFKCTNCGYEIYLQAWKAECPSCRSGFTLVMVAEEERRARPRLLGYIPPILLGTYLALTVFSPGFTVARLLPWPLAPIILLVVLMLSLTSSTVGNIATAGVGAALTIAHIALLGQQSLAEVGAATILAGLTALSIINEASIRRVEPKG